MAYDDKSSESRKNYHISPYESIYYPVWEEIVQFLNSNDIIADFGCGPGQLAKIIFDKGYNYSFGIDFSESAIKYAKAINKNFEHKFFVGNLYEGDIYRTGEYNTSIFCEVLEHLDRDIEVLKNIPSGIKTIISLPSFDSKSHVRFFNSIHDIKKRYRNILLFKESVEIKITDINRIFIISCIRI